jgi:hypothetical protein
MTNPKTTTPKTTTTRRTAKPKSTSETKVASVIPVADTSQELEQAEVEQLVDPIILPEQKRLVLSTSDKGGAGKSTWARAYAEMLIKHQIPTMAYDCDKRNAQLYRFYNKAFSSAYESGAGVIRLDLSVRGGSDVLINNLESANTQIVLVDFPAGGGELLEKLDKEIRLFDTLKETGYKMTAVSVLTRVKDAVNSLRTLLDYCGDRADYVAVKNLFYGEPHKFKRFDSSKTSNILLERGGIIINMPDLQDDTVDLLDDKDLTYSAAQERDSQIPFADKRRIKVFLEEFESEVMQAGRYLGF